MISHTSTPTLILDDVTCLFLAPALRAWVKDPPLGCSPANIRAVRSVLTEIDVMLGERRRSMFAGEHRQSTNLADSGTIEHGDGDTRRPDLMDTTQAADRLQMTVQSVTRLARGGEFPGAHKVGTTWLLPTAAIERYRRTRQQR